MRQPEAGVAGKHARRHSFFLDGKFAEVEESERLRHACIVIGPIAT
jgi:hypothetical protein